MGLSVWQILIIAVVAVLLFGRGRISDLMGDVAKGIKSFKKVMAEEDEDEMKSANKTIDHQASDAVSLQEKAEDHSKTSS
ncbi:twin-arginine translocase TatA/TatE family subunit [Breoghania sp.]|uniref:twin-arginine translocase TatA/TatE family subunit n=1 Tax=Breoghania sp. TaxID=2065378 RepID=UPI00260F6914|nr:twin-arginine translocase TatA/TatE family subunit [Breoghania sp.]MDJ0929626.1 twin-arginine translocase TatA/TatE family subunit [Breoghania sp.]